MSNTDIHTPRMMKVEEFIKETEQVSQMKNHINIRMSLSSNTVRQPLMSASKRFFTPRVERLEASSLRSNVKPTDEKVTIHSVVIDHNPMTFDKLKVRSTYPHSGAAPFVVLDKKKFTRHQANEQVYYEYTYKHPPIELYVCYGQKNAEKDYQEIIINFTSSILGRKKMELISINNIKDCFEMLDSEFHLIRITNIDNFINHAYVDRCDVTKDIHLSKDMARKFCKYTYINRRNTRASKVDIRQDPNFILENKVKSSSVQKERLTFYDKYRKLCIDKTRHGLLPAGFDVEMYKDWYRLELNLRNPRQIMSYLKISDNTLRKVLTSQEQPLLSCYNKLIQTPRSITSLVIEDAKTYKDYVVAKLNNFDIEVIEEILRHFYKPWRTSILQPYIDICNSRGRYMRDMQLLKEKVKDILSFKFDKTIKFANLIV